MQNEIENPTLCTLTTEIQNQTTIADRISRTAILPMTIPINFSNFLSNVSRAIKHPRSTFIKQMACASPTDNQSELLKST